MADITAWEKQHGRIPEGSVVMVRSDWSKKWTSDPAKAVALAADPVFPGVSLDAIKFLQLKRHILFHGHEPLDTDTTPTLEGEAWLMHHGYAQAEGVANLDKVPETGCLVSIGFPRFKGGTGGLAQLHRDLPARRQGREDLARRRAAEEVQLTAALGRDDRDPRPLSRPCRSASCCSAGAGRARRRRRPRTAGVRVADISKGCAHAATCSSLTLLSTSVNVFGAPARRRRRTCRR